MEDNKASTKPWMFKSQLLEHYIRGLKTIKLLYVEGDFIPFSSISFDDYCNLEHGYIIVNDPVKTTEE